MDYDREFVKNEVKKKFYGHDKLKCKVYPIMPQGIEREYIRLVNAYIAEYKKILIRNLAQIKKAIIADRKFQTAIRVDGSFEVAKLIDELFKKMNADVAKKPKTFGLRRKLESLANMTRKLSIQEWKKTCKATLGVDILDDYYMGEFYRQMMKIWVDENISLISSIPQESLGEMKEIIKNGFEDGATIKAITAEIEKRYGISKRRARLIAADQVAKLISSMAEKQQRDAGCNEYTWSSSMDQRVRSSHRKLNGENFSWDNPPIVDEKRGRRCHPGQDYRCRCVALPVFNLQNIKLPIQKGE